MEGEAAFTLFEMGYGGLAGIGNAIWHTQDSGFQAYEQVCNGKAYCGKEEARISSQAVSGDFLEIEYTHEPELITVVMNPSGEAAAAGMAVYENRVIILPYGRFQGRFQSHLNPYRQKILQEALKGMRSEDYPVFAEDAPYISVLFYDLGDRKALLLVNASPDCRDEVRIHVPSAGKTKVLELNRRCSGWMEADTVCEDEVIILKNGLAGLELKVLMLLQCEAFPQ